MDYKSDNSFLFNCIGTSKILALANEQSWNLVLHCHISSKPQLLQMGC